MNSRGDFDFLLLAIAFLVLGLSYAHNFFEVQIEANRSEYVETPAQVNWATSTPDDDVVPIPPGRYVAEGRGLIKQWDVILYLNDDQSFNADLSIDSVLSDKYSVRGTWVQNGQVILLSGEDGAVGLLGGRWRVERVTASHLDISLDKETKLSLTRTETTAKNEELE